MTFFIVLSCNIYITFVYKRIVSIQSSVSHKERAFGTVHAIAIYWSIRNLEKVAFKLVKNLASELKIWHPIEIPKVFLIELNINASIYVPQNQLNYFVF